MIDEIQKISHWSEIIKKIWDEKLRIPKYRKIKFILLGSSSLQIQKGLAESLVGRFQIINVYHWNFLETKELVNISLNKFLSVGGYPGSYKLIKNSALFESFIKNSIIEPVLNTDLLSFSSIQKVKFGKKQFSGGMELFLQKFPSARPVFINKDNYTTFLLHTEKFLNLSSP